jgi:hypothetical protein
METMIFDISPPEIPISPEIIARLMGFDAGNIPEPFGEIIQRELDEISNYPDIKGGFIVSGNIEINPMKGIFEFEGITFGAGMQVTGCLEGSEMLAFYICTAGGEVSARSSRLTGEGNLSQGYVADITGSLLVEGGMDILHERLAAEMAKRGCKLTNRYSPNYYN